MTGKGLNITYGNQSVLVGIPDESIHTLLLEDGSIVLDRKIFEHAIKDLRSKGMLQDIEQVVMVRESAFHHICDQAIEETGLDKKYLKHERL